MYVLYVIAVLANIPLTGIRANIIDNTRNKAGKYRDVYKRQALLMRPEAPKAGKRILLEKVGFIWKHLNFCLLYTSRCV